MKKLNYIRLTVIYFMLGISYMYATEINSAWPINAGPINPHLYSPNQMYTQMMIYEPLVRYENGKFIGEIADSWIVSDDGKTYTFKIKNDLKFSNGNNLDAYSIEKNFNAILDNKIRHSWLGLINKIQSAKAIDNKTFVLKLNSPYIATLNELSLPRPFRIIDPSMMINNGTKDGILKPIGSGPWVLKESIIGVKDVFIPNTYSNKKTNITKLTIKILPDPNSRILALKSGAVDILVGKDIISKENFQNLSKSDKYGLVKSKPQGTTNITINSNKIKDMNIRKAIIGSINKHEIWDKILLQIDKEADNLFQRDLEFCNIDLNNTTYDLQKSKDILQNTNYNNNELSLVYIANNPIQKAIGQSIQNDALKIGLNIKLSPSEPISFYQKQKNGDFDLIFNETWGNPFDPHSFISSMLIPSHADYAAQDGLENKSQIRDSIRSILNENNKVEMQKKYKALLELLNDSQIYAPISYSVILGAYNKNKIKSYKMGDMENDLRFENIETY